MSNPDPLVRVEVVPYYGQVELRDSECRDYPQWVSGTEKVVAIPGCVAVETRPDHLGSVVVEVWVEDQADNIANLTVVYRGRFVVSGPGVLVGNTVGSSLTPVAVHPGSYDLEVSVAPPTQPNQVRFTLVSLPAET